MRTSQLETETAASRETLARRLAAGAIPLKPLQPEVVRRKIQELDAKFQPPKPTADKLLAQSEVAHMRAQLGKGRPSVNVTYPLRPPFAFARIHFNPSQGEFNYDVQEPSLHQGEAELIDAIRTRMESSMDQEEVPVADLGQFGSGDGLQGYLYEKFLKVTDLFDIEVPAGRHRVIFYYLQRELVGLGRSDAIMRDPFVEDVSCNGPGVPVYVFHRVFGSVRTNVTYASEQELNRHILKLAQISGKHISVFQPILDATLTDGSRLNLTLGTEVTRKGSTFSIRRFTQDPISPVDLARLGSVSTSQLAYFWHLLQHKRSILVSGGTASGKTTLLNALSMFIRPEDKIVSIEDTPEVHLAHSNWIQSVARAGYGTGGAADGKQAGAVTLFDLLVAALRQRPEYVLVGEVRGREASTLFQAISTGHAAMATIHAGSIEELLHRIENEPMNIPRVLFEALDCVIFPTQVNLHGQRVRRLRSVTEILEVDKTNGNLLTNEVHRWDPAQDRFLFLGRSYALERIGQAGGKTLEQVEAEVARKQAYLDVLVREGVSHFRAFARAINDYYVDPERAVQQIHSPPRA